MLFLAGAFMEHTFLSVVLSVLTIGLVVGGATLVGCRKRLHQSFITYPCCNTIHNNRLNEQQQSVPMDRENVPMITLGLIRSNHANNSPMEHDEFAARVLAVSRNDDIMIDADVERQESQAESLDVQASDSEMEYDDSDSVVLTDPESDNMHVVINEHVEPQAGAQPYNGIYNDRDVHPGPQTTLNLVRAALSLENVKLEGGSL